MSIKPLFAIIASIMVATMNTHANTTSYRSSAEILRASSQWRLVSPKTRKFALFDT